MQNETNKKEAEARLAWRNRRGHITIEEWDRMHPEMPFSEVRKTVIRASMQEIPVRPKVTSPCRKSIRIPNPDIYGPPPEGVL